MYEEMAEPAAVMSQEDENDAEDNWDFQLLDLSEESTFILAETTLMTDPPAQPPSVTMHSCDFCQQPYTSSHI